MSDAPKCVHIKKKCKGCGEPNPDRKEACPACGVNLHCGNYPVAGYARCAYHGGPNPGNNYYGPGTMTTGAKAQFPIVRLAAKYNQMLTDGRVLSNRQAIDIADIRIRQLLERVDVEEAPERVAKLYSLWGEYQDAKKAGSSSEAAILEKRIDDEFEKIYHDYQAWKQIFEALNLRSQWVEREVKIATAINAVLTAEEAYQAFAKLLAAAMNVVGDDPKKMKRLQYEFSRIIGERSDRLAEPDVTADSGGSGEGVLEEGSGDMDQEGVLHPGDEE